jgi:hypothetical protein
MSLVVELRLALSCRTVPSICCAFDPRTGMITSRHSRRNAGGVFRAQAVGHQQARTSTPAAQPIKQCLR